MAKNIFIVFLFANAMLAEAEELGRTLPEVIVSEKQDRPLADLGLPGVNGTFVDAGDIAQRQPERTEQVLQQVLGITPSVSSAGLATAIQLRGFDISSQIQYNGHPDIQRLFVRDLATVERIEVLTGHQGVLFGQGAPGGTINYLGKRPQNSGLRQIKVSADEVGGSRLEVDIDSAKSAESNLSWRLVGAAQQGNTWIKNVPRDRQTVFGSFKVPVAGVSADAGELRFEVEHQQNQQPFSFGTVYSKGRFMYDRSYVASASRSDRRYDRLGVYFNQPLEGGWKLSSVWNVANVRRDEVLAGFAVVLNDKNLMGYYRALGDNARQYDGEVALGREWSVGSWSHRFKTGWRRDTQHIDFVARQNIGGFSVGIESPDFSTVNFAALPLRRRMTREDQQENGIYAVDRIAINDRLSLMVGLRRSRLTIDVDNGSLQQRVADLAHTTKSFGGAYTLADGLSAHVTYSDSFEPNRGRDRAGVPLQPRTGRQYETGVHWGTANHMRVALFDIKQSNLTASDPLDPTASITVGRVASRGVEVGFQRYLAPAVRVFGQAVAQRVRNEQTVSAAFGEGVAGMPARFGSANLAYQHGRLDTWFGLSWVGWRWGDPENTFKAPGYARLDLGGSYSIDSATVVHVVVRNFNNKKYVEYLDSKSNVYQGEPRNIGVSLVHRF